MSEILIDVPGAGAWIMARAQGDFRDGRDHSFASFRDGKILGGIATVGYLGGSMTLHMAGEDKRWFSRELAWLVFHYCFVQLGCRKLLAPVRSGNHKAIAQNMRAGWRFDTVLYDLFNPGPGLDANGGEHFIILSMTREQCPWLDYVPKTWRSNMDNAA